MKTIYTINRVKPDHLEAVKAEMMQLGAPTIRVVNCSDYYMALEGSHRLNAAKALGIKPNLVVFEQDDEIDITEYDWYDNANWVDGNDRYTAGEVAGELFSWGSEDVRFED